MSFFLITAYTGIFLLIFNVILYLKALPKKSKAFNLFVLYLVISLVNQILMTVMSKVLHISNLFMINIFIVLQFIILSLFYEKILINKQIKYILLIVVLLLVFQYAYIDELFFKYNPLGVFITHIVLSSYSLLYMYRSLQKKTPQFLIINIGLFLYLISSMLVFSSGNLVFNINISKEVYYSLLKVNTIMYIVFQILIFIEWRKNYYKKIPKSS